MKNENNNFKMNLTLNFEIDFSNLPYILIANFLNKIKGDLIYTKNPPPYNSEIEKIPCLNLIKKLENHFNQVIANRLNLLSNVTLIKILEGEILERISFYKSYNEYKGGNENE